MRRDQLLWTWLAFIAIMSLIGTMHACVNITPIEMRKIGMCFDGTQMRYVPCGK